MKKYFHSRDIIIGLMSTILISSITFLLVRFRLPILILMELSPIIISLFVIVVIIIAIAKFVNMMYLIIQRKGIKK